MKGVKRVFRGNMIALSEDPNKYIDIWIFDKKNAKRICHILSTETLHRPPGLIRILIPSLFKEVAKRMIKINGTDLKAYFDTDIEKEIRDQFYFPKDEMGSIYITTLTEDEEIIILSKCIWRYEGT